MLKKLPLIVIFSVLVCQTFMQGCPPPFLVSQQTWAEQTLGTMTLQEKIGQLFMVAVTSNLTNEGESLASQHGTLFYNMDTTYVTDLIKNYHVGGIIFLRKNDPKSFIDFLNMYQRMSAVPLLVGLDAEWGLPLRLHNTPRFPRALTLGALCDTSLGDTSRSDNSLIEQMGELVGKQCRAAGVHWNFAPDADVNNNPQNPVINDRSFGDSPRRVAQLATAYLRGLQKGGVLTCAKHFPGHGDTAIDSHVALPIISHPRERLDAVELYPFKELINAGVDGVMGAHLSVPALGVPAGAAASLSKNVMADLLQKELGFSGLVVTDALGMQAITDHYEPGEAELQALLAGNDVILCPTGVPAAVARIIKAVNEGRISQEDIDRRVLKILKAKQYVGLDHFTPASYQELECVCNEPHAQELKRSLYAQAITAVNGAEKLMPFTEVVISIKGMNKYAQQNFGVSDGVKKQVTDLVAQGKQVLVVLYGSPYSVSLFPQNVPILVAYEDDPDAQRAVAEILLGQRQLAGQLPVRPLVTPEAR